MVTGSLLPWKGSFLFDFRGDLFDAGRELLSGASLYHPAFLAHLAAIKHSGAPPITGFALPVYPPPVLMAVAPLSLLPFPVAGAIFLIVSLAAIIVGLYWLDVRDWRCFALAIMSQPTVSGLWFGALTPLIFLGGAAAWRWRARVLPPALAIASVVVAKLFPWTLCVWLLVTRRLRALVLTGATIVGVMAVGWAILGLAGILAYAHMLANLAYVEEGAGPSVVAVCLGLGMGATPARIIAFAAAGLLLGIAWRRARTGDERVAFGLAVMAALVASPVVWANYFVLLYIPIALTSRRLSGLWFLPLLMYFIPADAQHHVAQDALWVAADVGVILALCRARPGSFDRPARAVVSDPARHRHPVLSAPIGVAAE
jgi:hypothetical protein